MARLLPVLALLAGCADVRPLVDDMRRTGGAVHGPGILDPGNPSEFHGLLVERLGWKMDGCAVCHGADFAGGTSGVSCRTCHEGGPTACTTCHGQPPATGAHRAHLEGALARPLDCKQCHLVPMAYTEVGHLFREDGSVDPAPAEVVLAASAAYDGATGRCDGVYCHGATLGDAKTVAPRWSDPASGKCGTCHGMPPQGHSNSQCALCHPSDPAQHVDGKVQVGDGSKSCTACHGSPPPTGAHVAHAAGAHRLRGPIECADCHVVPADLHGPGHIDSETPAEVFPSVQGFSSVARADGAKATWDHAGARCGDVYCHGGGQRAAKDGAQAIDRAPSWNAPGPAICGSCHGIPPQDGLHDPKLTLAQCAACHPKTVDAKGVILLDNSSSFHMNGVVDAL